MTIFIVYLGGKTIEIYQYNAIYSDIARFLNLFFSV